MGMTRDEQLEVAVDRIIETWDTAALANYARKSLLDYYLTRADKEEQDLLLEHFDGEDVPSYGD